MNKDWSLGDKLGRYFPSVSKRRYVTSCQNISHARYANTLSICESLEMINSINRFKLKKITLQYFNSFISGWISRIAIFTHSEESELTPVGKRATQLVTRQVLMIECSKGNKGKVYFTCRGNRMTCNELLPLSYRPQAWKCYEDKLIGSCVAVCLVLRLHPSVSHPVTIDGFLCLPAHRGIQVIK